ncbi:hypothetical protein [Halomonas halodenitrificans]|uniref:hypothetical protein n=1 Tax=Halomonas halodenitrificans TaxID=28252 RepID=UPI000AD395E0|nr:hypothetical protein [Halomonas halodenitrificans]
MSQNPFDNPMLEWWQQQWPKGVNPMVRLQQAWLENLAEALQFEAEFLMAIAQSGERIARTFDGPQPTTPEEVKAYYEALVKEMSDAQMKSLEQASRLSHDFRKRLWEKI